MRPHIVSLKNGVDLPIINGMSMLSNFQLLNQLGHGNNNDQFNCVPTCIAAGLQNLTGRMYSGGELKDACYGSSYTGCTAAAAYIDYCSREGVILTNIKGEGMELVSAIRNQLKLGHPVIGTEDDPYCNPSLGWSHVIIFYASDNSTLTCMDPWGAQSITRSFAEWANMLRFGEVWTLYKKGDSLMGGIPHGWRDDGTVLTAPNGIKIIKGFRQYILSHTWDEGNLPLENEQACSQLERGNPKLGAGSRQRFRMATLEWTTQRGVFEAWTGQELIALDRLLGEQQAQQATLAASMKTLQSQVADLNARITLQANVQISKQTYETLAEIVKALAVFVK